MSTFRDPHIVVTYDGLFLTLTGQVTQEYPDANWWPTRGAAERAAKAAKNLGPYEVLDADEYQMRYES